MTIYTLANIVRSVKSYCYNHNGGSSNTLNGAKVNDRLIRIEDIGSPTCPKLRSYSQLDKLTTIPAPVAERSSYFNRNLVIGVRANTNTDAINKRKSTFKIENRDKQVARKLSRPIYKINSAATKATNEQQQQQKNPESQQVAHLKFDLIKSSTGGGSAGTVLTTTDVATTISSSSSNNTFSCSSCSTSPSLSKKPSSGIFVVGTAAEAAAGEQTHSQQTINNRCLCNLIDNNNITCTVHLVSNSEREQQNIDNTTTTNVVGHNYNHHLHIHFYIHHYKQTDNQIGTDQCRTASVDNGDDEEPITKIAAGLSTRPPLSTSDTFITNTRTNKFPSKATNTPTNRYFSKRSAISNSNKQSCNRASTLSLVASSGSPGVDANQKYQQQPQELIGEREMMGTTDGAGSTTWRNAADPMLTARAHTLTTIHRLGDHHHHLLDDPRCVKVNLDKGTGGLGFTIMEKDRRIYVRELVRNPALSDGRIKPGDQIISVNGESMCDKSREQAIQLLRGLHSGSVELVVRHKFADEDYYYERDADEDDDSDVAQHQDHNESQNDSPWSSPSSYNSIRSKNDSLLNSPRSSRSVERKKQLRHEALLFLREKANMRNQQQQTDKRQ